MRYFLPLLFALFFCLGQSAGAQDSGPGLFIRNGTSTLSSPVIGQTYVLDYSGTTPALKYWNGSVYNPITPPQANFAGSGAPTTSNDNTQGYAIGSIWYSTTGNVIYMCTSAATGAATWQNISMASNDKFTTVDWIGDFLVSGMVGSVPSSSLTMTTPLGVAYVTGLRTAPLATTYTYPINSDTYDYMQTSAAFLHVSQANGASPPIGQPGLLIQKVVTNGTVITGVTEEAAMLPTIELPTAVNSGDALSLGQANGLYAPIGSTGSVTSVAMTVPSFLAISGSPITTSGTLAVTLNTAGAATLFGNATGSSAAPSSFSAGTTDQVVSVAHSGGGLEGKTITAGSGVTVTPSTGAITIAATGVTSAAYTGDGVLFNSTVSGSPITTTGTFVPALLTHSAATIFGNGTGSTAAPTFFSAGTTDQIIGVAHSGGGIEGKTLTAGTGISVTPTAGVLTVANTGVTSVALSLPGIFSVSGSPVTTTGTLSGSLANQSAATLFGNATGSSAAPTMFSVGTTDQVLGVAHAGGGLEGKSIVAGSGIAVTNTAGSISIASTSSGGSVTNFTAGNLSPIFTTSVATSTSTPALSFSLSTVAASSVLMGPNGAASGAAPSAAAPTNKTLTPPDIPMMFNQVRLYPQTGVPFYAPANYTFGTVATFATLYIGPCGGNHITTYNTTQSAWIDQTFSEISFSVAGLSNGVYDAFVQSASNTTISEINQAWTSNTARNAGHLLTLLNGRYVDASDSSKLYVATFYVNGGVVSLSGVSGEIWNYFNRTMNSLAGKDTTASWTYTSSSFRNANNTDSIAIVIGVDEDPIVAEYISSFLTGAYGEFGVGIDSTTVNSAIGTPNTTFSSYCAGRAVYVGHPGIGFHTIYPLEASPGGSTFYGTNTIPSASSPYGANSAMTIQIRN